MKPVAQSVIQFEIIRDETAFFNLEQEWTALYAQSDDSQNIFLTFEWNRIWYETFFEDLSVYDSKLQIIVGRVDGRAVLILPLLGCKRFGVQQLRWIGDPVSQYGSVLYDTALDLGVLVSQAFAVIKKHLVVDVLILPGVVGNSPLSKAFQAEKALQYGRHIAPFIDLLPYQSFELYQKSRSKSARKQERRLRRKFTQDEGELSFMMIAGDEGQAEKFVRIALRLKEQNLKQGNIYSSAFATGKMESFFVALARENYPGMLVSVLSCKGKPVAIEIGLYQGDYYVSHLGVYDMAYRKYSPGKLQMEDTFRALYQKGIRTIDLLPPDDAYKYLTANKTEDIVDFGVSFSLRGEFYLRGILQNIRPMAKNMKNKLASKRMPQSLKKAVSLVSDTIKSRNG